MRASGMNADTSSISRRQFIAVATAATVGAIHLRASAQGRTAERFTSVVPDLRKVSQVRRDRLAANADSLEPRELNALLPEITEIELHNKGTTPPAAGRTLRIAAWNMERGRHWEDGANLIREHVALKDAGVVLLGEMDLGMARSGNVHTTRNMADVLGMNYAYAIEFIELTGGEKEERERYPGANERGYHGNAILSRYPMRNLRMLRFPGIEKWFGDYQQRLGGRNALLAEIDFRGHSVTLCSTHLESGGTPTDDAFRTEQGRYILTEILDHAGDAPVLLGGDLNARPNAQVIADLRESGIDIDSANDLTANTVQRVAKGRVETYAAHIDYLCPRGVEVVRGEFSPAVVLAAYPLDPEGKMLGDHAIVTAELQL